MMKSVASAKVDCLSMHRSLELWSKSKLIVLRLCTALALMVGPNGIRGQDVAKGPTASVTRPVHPVLIRNEHGPLLRIVVEVEKGVKARTSSLVFNLDGTDELGDLDSLRLYATGDKDGFSPATPVGVPVVPEATVTFPVDQPL